MNSSKSERRTYVHVETWIEKPVERLVHVQAKREERQEIVVHVKQLDPDD